jgi:flagella basal body P-ring formation protein FlgA
MNRLFGLLLLTFWLAALPAFAEPVTLRARIEASGGSILIGDVFEHAPAEIAARAIAPSPAPGQVATIPVSLLTAVASAAGLEWVPPAGLSEVRVVRPGGMRATLPGPAQQDRYVIRRGDPATISYVQGGIEIAVAGARADENGALGERIRFVNPSSERTIEAIVTGPGAARTGTP